MREQLRWLGWLLIVFSVLSCTGKSNDILTLASAPTTTSYIITTSWDGNHRGVGIYDLNGNYLSHTDYKVEGMTPRGLAVYQNNTVLVSGDGNDGIYQLSMNGTSEIFFGSNTLAGTIYDIEYDATGGYIYVIESNNIEAFDTAGVRIDSKRIPTNTGACTLVTPVSMTINTAGNLVVANVGGGDEILTYDITTSPPTCLSAVAFGNDPYSVLQHSNGNLYVATRADDQVYQADIDGQNPVVVWATDTTIINNPIALAKLPNGNLLVSSSATDRIEQITTAGVRVGNIPFIFDAFSLNVGDIVVINNEASTP